MAVSLEARGLQCLASQHLETEARGPGVRRIPMHGSMTDTVGEAIGLIQRDLDTTPGKDSAKLLRQGASPRDEISLDLRGRLIGSGQFLVLSLFGGIATIVSVWDYVSTFLRRRVERISLPCRSDYVSTFCGGVAAGAWRVAALGGPLGAFPPVVAGWCRRGCCQLSASLRVRRRVVRALGVRRASSSAWAPAPGGSAD